MSEQERFDGLFMSAIQNAHGIENFFDAMFSFMRRKTDFFTIQEQSENVVKRQMEKHAALFQEDTKRQELIKKKQAEEKAKKEAENKKNQPMSGATVEEIDDEEAKKIELQNLLQKQKEAKEKLEQQKKEGKTEKKDGDEEKVETFKQKPNAGNGGQTDKYTWHQTLEEVTAYIKLPDKTVAKDLDVKIQISSFKVTFKSRPNEPIVDGKWNKKINPGESFWSVEKDGDKSTLLITLEKFEGKNWWNCLLEGDIEIDTQKVEPENSKLSDLDGETRSTVEKMMYDQQQKAMGKQTSEEQDKKNKLKAFMDAHPEMDFSKAKFC